MPCANLVCVGPADISEGGEGRLFEIAAEHLKCLGRTNAGGARQCGLFCQYMNRREKVKVGDLPEPEER